MTKACPLQFALHLGPTTTSPLPGAKVLRSQSLPVGFRPRRSPSGSYF